MVQQYNIIIHIALYRIASSEWVYTSLRGHQVIWSKPVLLRFKYLLKNTLIDQVQHIHIALYRIASSDPVYTGWCGHQVIRFKPVCVCIIMLKDVISKFQS